MQILCLAYRDWTYAERTGINVRDLHLMIALANRPEVQRVLTIPRPMSIPEWLLNRRKLTIKNAKLVCSGSCWRLYQSNLNDKLFILNILSFDVIGPIVYTRRWWDRAISTKYFKNIYNLISAALNFKPDVLLNWTPFAPSVNKIIDSKLYAFDVIDNFSNHARITSIKEKEFVTQAYKLIGENVSIITSVSKQALTAFGENCKATTKVIRNGVDVEWTYAKPKKPNKLNELIGPIVGTGGMFFNKFDGDMLVQLADHAKWINFVLVGKFLDKDLKLKVLSRSNIHYYGQVKYSDLHAFYYHFDVAFMMYKPELENDGDPLKLYEFLAAGTPVVATPSMGVGRHSEGVYVAESVSEFYMKIKWLLKMDREKIRLRCRNQILSEDTWNYKAQEMLTLFNNQLDH